MRQAQCLALLSLTVLLCTHSAAAQQQIDPAFAVNLTLYHQDQDTVAPGIENKDTADAPGDTYFVLKDVGLARECREDPRSFDCQNPEVNSDDLVVTKLVVQVDSRWGNYGMCNVNNETGNYHCNCEPAMPKNCSAALQEFCGEQKTRGAIWCKLCVESKSKYWDYFKCTSTQVNDYCTSTSTDGAGATAAFQAAMAQPSAPSVAPPLGYPPSPPCPPQVGHELVVDNGSVGRNPNSSSHSADYDYWNYNMAHHVGGNWYSTVTAGKCNSTGTGPCFWKVLDTVKRVKSNCLNGNVQAKVQASGASCFNDCPDKGQNVSSDCYAKCFFDTALGPGSGSTTAPAGGISANTLVGWWTSGFLTDDPTKGGCPSVPVEPYEKF